MLVNLGAVYRRSMRLNRAIRTYIPFSICLPNVNGCDDVNDLNSTKRTLILTGNTQLEDPDRHPDESPTTVAKDASQSLIDWPGTRRRLSRLTRGDHVKNVDLPWPSALHSHNMTLSLGCTPPIRH